MTFWLATFNHGKIKEFESLFDPKFFQFKLAKDAIGYSPPAETGATFIENAKIKAEALFAVINEVAPVLAEDSGLVVEGLGGYPGVFSARYAGDNASDAQNCDKVLKMLKIRSPLNRKAKFVSCIYFKSKDLEFHVQGEVQGTIAQGFRGTSGFGYDPIFIPEGYEQTMSELGLATKNKISHRKKTVQALKEILNDKHSEWFR